jgi:serine/threonine protein kinase
MQYHVATPHDLVPGYRWLYDVPKILHRDISLNNLMLRKEGDNVYAVLNDLDLAVSADVKSMSSKHRTGTKPFMAIDLIHPDPTVHMYRHDLESMFYVLVWITSRFHNGQEITDPPLQEWADNGGVTLLKEKNSFLMSMPPRRTEQFESFGRWIASMQKMFLDGLHAHASHLLELSVTGPQTSFPLPFANDTLNGLVTFDKFQTILDAGFP